MTFIAQIVADNDADIFEFKALRLSLLWKDGKMPRINLGGDGLMQGLGWEDSVWNRVYKDFDLLAVVASEKLV